MAWYTASISSYYIHITNWIQADTFARKGFLDTDLFKLSNYKTGVYITDTYVLYSRAPFRARINLSHFGADINYLIYLVKLFSKFRGGAKKQPVPWPGGPG